MDHSKEDQPQRAQSVIVFSVHSVVINCSRKYLKVSKIIQIKIYGLKKLFVVECLPNYPYDL